MMKKMYINLIHGDKEMFLSNLRENGYFTIGNLKVIGEQNGLPEEELKIKLKELFQKTKSKVEIKKAYLVKTIYDEKAKGITLLLKAKNAHSELLFAEISDLFSSIFNADQFLDIMYIDEEQEFEIEKVARAFFSESK